MPDVREEEINKRNGETEEEGTKKREILDVFSLASVLSSPPFLRSSCSSSFELGKVKSGWA